MKIKLYLRDTQTGLSGVVEHNWILEPYSVSYHYDEGNYGCDDNRVIFLASVNPEFDALDDVEDSCNIGPNRVAIDKIEDENGCILYSDEWRS